MLLEDGEGLDPVQVVHELFLLELKVLLRFQQEVFQLLRGETQAACDRPLPPSQGIPRYLPGIPLNNLQDHLMTTTGSAEIVVNE